MSAISKNPGCPRLLNDMPPPLLANVASFLWFTDDFCVSRSVRDGIKSNNFKNEYQKQTVQHFRLFYPDRQLNIRFIFERTIQRNFTLFKLDLFQRASLWGVKFEGVSQEQILKTVIRILVKKINLYPDGQEFLSSLDTIKYDLETFHQLHLWLKDRNFLAFCHGILKLKEEGIVDHIEKQKVPLRIKVDKLRQIFQDRVDARQTKGVLLFKPFPGDDPLSPLTEIPEEILDLPNLEELSLAEQPIDYLDPRIAKLSKLNVVNLRKSKVRYLPRAFIQKFNVFREETHCNTPFIDILHTPVPKNNTDEMRFLEEFQEYFVNKDLPLNVERPFDFQKVKESTVARHEAMENKQKAVARRRQERVEQDKMTEKVVVALLICIVAYLFIKIYPNR